MDEEVELNRNMNESEKKKNDDDDDHGKEVFRWELLLPKKTVTVLLVESDRSTRRLITSLLMNCNYKGSFNLSLISYCFLSNCMDYLLDLNCNILFAVIAVSDGVKAWKTLQMKEIDVDIVLAEMELPEISGLALLSLMMEHETCRNIPLLSMFTCYLLLFGFVCC